MRRHRTSSAGSIPITGDGDAFPGNSGPSSWTARNWLRKGPRTTGARRQHGGQTVPDRSAWGPWLKITRW